MTVRFKWWNEGYEFAYELNSILVQEYTSAKDTFDYQVNKAANSCGGDIDRLRLLVKQFDERRRSAHLALANTLVSPILDSLAGEHTLSREEFLHNWDVLTLARTIVSSILENWESIPILHPMPRASTHKEIDEDFWDY